MVMLAPGAPHTRYSHEIFTYDFRLKFFDFDFWFLILDFRCLIFHFWVLNSIRASSVSYSTIVELNLNDIRFKLHHFWAQFERRPFQIRPFLNSISLTSVWTSTISEFNLRDIRSNSIISEFNGIDVRLKVDYFRTRFDWCPFQPWPFLNSMWVMSVSNSMISELNFIDVALLASESPTEPHGACIFLMLRRAP